MEEQNVRDIEGMNASQKRVAEAIRAFKKGAMVAVTDDDDRENEADLIIGATLITAEQMAFVVRHTSGIVCAPMSADYARRLRLEPMVANNNAPQATAFTTSVDFRQELNTGISAVERARTIRALADSDCVADDFIRPGHVFPLVSRDGGVLIRSGHTEAAVDLCRLAGLPPVAAICELVNDDGSVKRGQELVDFAGEHDIYMLSISDLIAWRQRTENLVERVSEQPVITDVGPAYAVTYSVPHDSMHHVAVIFGDILDGRNIPVRLQSESVLDDVFCADSSIPAAMRMISERGRGVIVYLREGSVGVARQSGRPRDGEAPAPENHESAQKRDAEWREIGIGAQILRDLGVNTITLMASRHRHYVGLSGFGVEIEQTELIES